MIKMFPRHKKNWLFCPTLLCLMMTPCAHTLAQTEAPQITITPSHVYQETENFRTALESINLIKPQTGLTNPPDTFLRHPRHVIQKVRECNMLLAKILKARNIEPAPIPPLFSAKEIRPLDVKNGVEHLLSETQKLGATNPSPAPFVDGKLPSDVYNNLKNICDSITVKIEPADVYRVALAVNQNMKKIATNRGLDEGVDKKYFAGKIPADVYGETWLFLEHLQALALNPDYAIPGGVIVPPEKAKGEIKPQDVMGLMNDALAETNAMKYTLHIQETVELPPLDPSRTPSDVYAEIYNAHKILQKLYAAEEKLNEDIFK